MGGDNTSRSQGEPTGNPKIKRGVGVEPTGQVAPDRSPGRPAFAE
jgi:hypothetical protein